MNNASTAIWATGKRVFHWALALAVLVALIAPKPEDGEGFLHILAGTSALALVMMRLGWRLLGDVRPYVKNAWRIKMPDTSKGGRGFAPLLMQVARLGGLIFLVLIPIAVGLALAGIGQGEDSPYLEAHEAVGTVIMILAIGHAVAVIIFSLIVKYDLFRVTLFGVATTFFEGGTRGVWGLVLGAALGLATLGYIWGPFDLASKALSQTEQGTTGKPSDSDDD